MTFAIHGFCTYSLCVFGVGGAAGGRWCVRLPGHAIWETRKGGRRSWALAGEMSWKLVHKLGIDLSCDRVFVVHRIFNVWLAGGEGPLTRVVGTWWAMS